MRKGITAFVVFLIIITSISNLEASEWEPEWTTSSDFIISTRSILLDKNLGKIYIGGDDGTYSYYPRILQLDKKNGAKGWKKEIHPEKSECLHETVFFQEKLFVLSAERENKSYYNIMSKDGNLLKRGYVGENIYTVTKYEPDSLILIEQNGEGIFHVVDTNFQIIRSIKFTDHIDGKVTGSARDGSIIISGGGYNNTGLTNCYFSIQKVNLYSGKTEWQLKFEDGIRGFHDRDANGNVYLGLTQMVKKNDSDLSQFKTIRITPQGKIDWEKAWHQENTVGVGKSNWINDLKTNKDGLIAITGQIERDGKNWAYIRVIRTYDGSVFREKEFKFNQTSDDHLADKIAWNDRQLYLLGKSYGLIKKSYTQHYDLRILDVKSPQALKDFKLRQNYPNPFNSNTTIEYYLPTATRVTIEIYNAVGQKIKQVTQEKQKGSHEYQFYNSSKLQSGVYFYKIRADHFTKTRKMLLIK